MMHSFEKGLKARSFVATAEGAAVTRKDNIVGLSLYGLLAGPVLAVLALVFGFGWIVALVAFWLGGSGSILALAVINQWRSVPVTHETESTDQELATA